MPVKNVTTAGTRVQLTTTRSLCARLTLQWKPANTSTTSIYVGFPGGQGVGNLVSSTVYDLVLNSGNTSVTIGMGQTYGNSIDPTGIWLDSSASGEGVTWFAEFI